MSEAEFKELKKRLRKSTRKAKVPKEVISNTPDVGCLVVINESKPKEPKVSSAKFASIVNRCYKLLGLIECTDSKEEKQLYSSELTRLIDEFDYLVKHWKYKGDVEIPPYVRQKYQKKE